jgi:hypothetical protein
MAILTLITPYDEVVAWHPGSSHGKFHSLFSLRINDQGISERIFLLPVQFPAHWNVFSNGANRQQ